MGQGWIRIAAVTAVAASSLAAVAYAADMSANAQDRQARFASYSAAHPKLDAEIARIKAKTAGLVAAARATDIQASLEKPPVIWRVSDKPLEVWDGADYPEMVIVPAGEFTMGTPLTEPFHQTYEAPLHRVRIGYSFAVSKYPVTVGEFAAFVADTHYDAGDACFTGEQGKQPMSGRNWRQPSFEQASTHPVACMNFNDAEAYAAWLSKKTGHAYRLLSEAEYEYATRAGSTTTYWWGEDPAAACAYANGADMDAQAHFPTVNTCRDGYVFTSPVGSFKPNAFGLYDMIGNVWTWQSDCWNTSYDGAPTDGSANASGDCSARMLRRGSFSARPPLNRSGGRIRYPVATRVDDHGIRVARIL